LEAKRTSIARTAQNQARQASYDRNAPNKDEHRAQAQTAIDQAQARYAAAKAKR
jgi:hypothetical protein